MKSHGRYLCPECNNLLESSFCSHCQTIIPQIQNITRAAKIAAGQIPIELILQGENPHTFKPLVKETGEQNAVWWRTFMQLPAKKRPYC